MTRRVDSLPSGPTSGTVLPYVQPLSRATERETTSEFSAGWSEPSTTVASIISSTGPPAAEMSCCSPPSTPNPNARYATSPTSSTPEIRSSMAPGSGTGGPCEATPWTTTSALMSWSMMPLMLSLVVAPSVPNAATRVSPRVSANAVAAVRRVLRPALVAASRPTAPKGAPMTRPMPPAMGRARAGITRKLPTIRAAAPTPTVIAPDLVVSCHVPMSASAIPATTARTPT